MAKDIDDTVKENEDVGEPLFNNEDLKDLREKRVEIFMKELKISKREAERWADEDLKFYREEIEAFA